MSTDDDQTTIPGTPELPTDAPPEDTPPSRRRPRRARAGAAPSGAAGKAPGDKSPRGRGRPSKAATAKQVADSATALHQLGGALALPAIGLPQTGAALLASAEDAGQIWAALSQRYPLIARLFATGGDGVLFFKLLMLYAPIISVAMSERSGKAGAPPAGMPDLSSLLNMAGAPAPSAGE